MYIPEKYAAPDWADHKHLIQDYPLGTVITKTAEHGFIVNHIPFILVEEGERPVLRAHLARVNPQVPALTANDDVVVVFQSTSSYIRPSYYPSKAETHKVVPTWDFAAVHVYGKSKIVNSDTYVRSQLDKLTEQMEKGQADEWTVDEAPPRYTELKLNAITGLEIEITRTEAKFKFEQKMARQDIDGVIDGLDRDGRKEVSAMVRRANA